MFLSNDVKNVVRNKCLVFLILKRVSYGKKYALSCNSFFNCNQLAVFTRVINFFKEKIFSKEMHNKIQICIAKRFHSFSPFSVFTRTLTENFLLY